MPGTSAKGRHTELGLAVASAAAGTEAGSGMSSRKILEEGE
jgi:hypothetical protein